MGWHEDAVTLSVQGLELLEIVERLSHYWPNDTRTQVRKRLWLYLNRQEGKQTEKQTVEYSDECIVSTKFIELQQGVALSPTEIMEIHGFDPLKWKVKYCINNFWNSQLKGGMLQVSYQSKVTLEPIEQPFDFDAIDAYFGTKEFKYDKPLTKAESYDANGEILEIDLPDLHAGLLSWREETGQDYDIHIAKDRFYQSIYSIRDRCVGRKFKKIVFATLGDLLHIDNDKQTTNKGTFQDTDGRLAKIVDATLDMLIDGITVLGNIAPVDVVYVCGNHDRNTGYLLMKGVEKAFRFDNNVSFDTAPNPHKYRRFGVALVGFTHGDMPRKNISGWLLQNARKEFGECKFVEVHAGHFHSQKGTEKPFTNESDSGIVIRHLPALCSASYWEHQQGYAQSVKTVVSFVWSETNGLRDIWFSNI